MFTPFNQLGMDLVKMNYRGVTMTLAEFPNAVSIYSCDSTNEGKGEVQEAIQILKDRYGKVFGSVPLNPAMQHIYDKMGVDYLGEDI